METHVGQRESEGFPPEGLPSQTQGRNRLQTDGRKKEGIWGGEVQGEWAGRVRLHSVRGGSVVLWGPPRRLSSVIRPGQGGEGTRWYLRKGLLSSASGRGLEVSVESGEREGERRLPCCPQDPVQALSLTPRALCHLAYSHLSNTSCPRLTLYG